jgi:hypothetical protein
MRPTKMSMRKLKLMPGVDVEQSPSLNQSQLTASNLIRFYGGLPQNRGGWQQMTSQTFVGTASGLHGWADVKGNPYLAVGTEQRLEVFIAGMLYDITPLIHTENPAVAFSTVISTTTVTITDAAYSPNVGDWINLTTHVSVGGIVLFGFYRVTSIVDATHYTITAALPATSTVTNSGAVTQYTTLNTTGTVTVTLANHGLTTGALFDAAVSVTVATVTIFGNYSITFVSSSQFTITVSGTANASTTVSENSGNAQIEYLLPNGLSTATALSGYGIGPYGGGGYGVGGGSTLLAPNRQWSLDNFGQDLIASPTNGAIYYWQPPTVTPAVVVSGTAPIYNTAVLVMSQAQIIVALGAELSGTQQPLLVRWCDAGDFTDWTPSPANQAGSYTIPQGTRLVGGFAAGLTAYLWTDVGLYTMTYVGLPFVFSFQPLGYGCGLLGMRAHANVGALVMWVSNHGFFIMTLGGGGAVPIECPVWDILFNNWDLENTGSFTMGANTLTNEFELFFPLATTSPFYVAGSVTFGSVKYNYVEKVWDYTISPQLQRTAWEGHWNGLPGQVGNPVGADTAGLLQQHEIGFTANGAAMLWSWTTGFFDIAEGEEMVFVDWVIPDFVTTGGPAIDIIINTTVAPNAPVTSSGNLQVDPTTYWVPPFGLRGRQMQISCAGSGSNSNTFARLGALRYRVASDGRGP